MTAPRATPGLGTTTLAVTCALLAGVAGGTDVAALAMAGGFPAGFVRPAGAWRISVVMATAYGLGLAARYASWVLFDEEGQPPQGAVVVALLACALAPGVGALLRRLSEQLERVG